MDESSLTPVASAFHPKQTLGARKCQSNKRKTLSYSYGGMPSHGDDATPHHLRSTAFVTLTQPAFRPLRVTLAGFVSFCAKASEGDKVEEVEDPPVSPGQSDIRHRARTPNRSPRLTRTRAHGHARPRVTSG